MAGITLAWLVGEAIIIWRSVGRNHRPPMPGELLAGAGFFAITALLAEYPPARTTATLLAWGIVLAAYLEAPVITPASSKTAAASPAPSAAASTSSDATLGTGGVRVTGT